MVRIQVTPTLHNASVEIVGILATLCFESFGKVHEHRKHCVGHTHQLHPLVLSVHTQCHNLAYVGKVESSISVPLILMHVTVEAWARPYARARKYTEKIEYYTEVWLYYTEAWLRLTWQSIKKRVASEFKNVVS